MAQTNLTIRIDENIKQEAETLFNKIGGSMGPIYGTLFMEMSSPAEGAQDITPILFSEMLRTGITGLYDIVDARVGDKTLIDTLEPAIEAFQSACEARDDFAKALDAMKEAAQKGRDSTKDLAARYGRSARLGERSRGVLDAGAVSCCILVEAIADGMKFVMES